jgi:tetratricopeptide (TPR) repeat protein
MRIEERIWSCYDEVGATALRHNYLQIADVMFSASLEEAQRNQSDIALQARSCFGLAATYQRKGRAREAMHYYRKAISGFEKGNDSTLNWLASSCENLALLHIADGTLARARSLLRRALAIYQKLFGEKHPVLIPAMVHLGYIYSEYGQPDKAVYYYRMAKEIECLQNLASR